MATKHKVTRKGLEVLFGSAGKVMGAGEVMPAIQKLIAGAGLSTKDLAAHGIKSTEDAWDAFATWFAQNAQGTGEMWLATLKPAVEIEIEEEAPAGPSQEDIAAAKKQYDDAVAFAATASPAMKKVADEMVTIAKTEYEALSGKAEVEAEDESEEIEFAVLQAGELPTGQYVSGAVVLSPDAVKALLNGPAWIKDAGRPRAMCDPKLQTGKGTMFVRVYGADATEYLPRVIAIGKVLKVSFMPADETHGGAEGKVGAMFIGDYQNGEDPVEVRVLDMNKTGDWFVVGAVQKRGGGKLGGSTKGGTLGTTPKGGRLGGH